MKFSRWLQVSFLLIFSIFRSIASLNAELQLELEPYWPVLQSFEAPLLFGTLSEAGTRSDV